MVAGLRSCIPGLALVLVAGPVWAGTVFENRIATMNPCAGLKTRILGVPITIDHLDSVRIDRFSLTLEGDAITAALTGALSCRTSDGATVRGSVGADIAVTARLVVPGCAVEGLDVGLSNIGGDFGPALEALRDPAEVALGEALREPLVTACQALVESLAP